MLYRMLAYGQLVTRRYVWNCRTPQKGQLRYVNEQQTEDVKVPNTVFMWCSSRLCSRSSTFHHVHHPTQHPSLLTFFKWPPFARRCNDCRVTVR